MLGKELLIGRLGVVGKNECFAGKSPEVFRHAALREFGLFRRSESRRRILSSKAMRYLVERGVVQPGEAESIAHIETLLRELAPRQDVGDDEEVAHGEAAHAAASAKIVEHRVAEILLPPADFCRELALRGPKNRG